MSVRDSPEYETLGELTSHFDPPQCREGNCTIFLFLQTSFQTASIFSFSLSRPFNPHTRLKKGSWISFSRSHTLIPNLQLSRKPPILCPPKTPWSTPSSCNNLVNDPPYLRNAVAISHLCSLPHSDITDWIDSSVAGRLGVGGAH